MADRSDILRRVQALITKADRTTFDEERDALLTKADELMFKYAIESYEIDAARDKKDRKEQIVKRSIPMVNNDSPVIGMLIDLMSSVAKHTRCRVVYSGAQSNWLVSALVVGFESDTEYCEMMYTSLWLQMTNHLEPKPDPDLSFEENVVMLLENGLKRERVCQLFDMDYMSNHAKISRIYRKYCEANGVNYKPRSRPTGSTYAQNFARGFASRVSARFWEIRQAQGDSVAGTGTELALRDRDSEVKDALKDMFPELSSLRRRAEGKFNETARTRGDAAGKVADLGQARMAGNRKSLEGR